LDLSCNNLNEINKISTDFMKHNESIDLSYKEKDNDNKILRIIDLKGKNLNKIFYIKIWMIL